MVLMCIGVFGLPSKQYSRETIRGKGFFRWMFSRKMMTNTTFKLIFGKSMKKKDQLKFLMKNCKQEKVMKLNKGGPLKNIKFPLFSEAEN
eukprot:snap_masked-scaffold_112-processed-gene-0.1-mRNA-1 protein AED:1.00 eAED:1.00 QI:0/0/0/0/1/1/2/0/89